MKNGIESFTLGVLEDAHYQGFSEKSFAVKLFGQTGQVLNCVAKELADEFKQEKALVIDFNSQETRTINGTLANT